MPLKFFLAKARSGFKGNENCKGWTCNSPSFCIHFCLCLKKLQRCFSKISGGMRLYMCISPISMGLVRTLAVLSIFDAESASRIDRTIL